MNKIRCLVLVGLLMGYVSQAQDRFGIMENKLNDLAKYVPGLNKEVNTTVSYSSLNEFLQGIGIINNVNLNIDTGLTQRVPGSYANVTVKDLLLFFARQYNLEISVVGSIITVSPYRDPLAGLPPPPKQVAVTYNADRQWISMDLQEDSLLNVAKKITQLTNINIVVLPELFGKRVTGYLLDMPVANALEKIAYSNLFKLNRTNDNVYVLEALKPNEQIVPKQQPIPNANFSVQQINPNPAGGTYNSSINVTDNGGGKKLVTLSAAGLPLKEAIRSIAEQASVNYFIYSEIEGTTTGRTDNIEFDSALTFILRGSPYTYNITNGVYMIGNRQNEGLRGYRIVQLKHRSADSLMWAIPQELRKGVEIKEFKELNSLLISGSDPLIQEVETVIRELDRVVPMVLVEVIILDVQNTRSVSTGLTLGVSDSARIGGTLFGAGTNFTLSSGDINRLIDRIGLNNVFNIGRVTPNFYATLKAMEESSNIDIRQTPKLSTLNGHQADYRTGSERYYVKETENIGGGLTPIRTITREFIKVEANLFVKVRPFVSGDEQVTLNINVGISDFIGPLRVNEPPPKATNEFNSMIRVKNEEMIVVGGIEREEKSESGSGTPLLSRIPLLKWLFSNRTKTKGKTVSIVFIKPTIIYN